MHRFTWFGLAAAALAGTVALTPNEASACGGFFCDAGIPMAVDQTGEDILFVMDEQTVEVHIRIQYMGDPANFAWVIPDTGGPVDPDAPCPAPSLTPISTSYRYGAGDEPGVPTIALLFAPGFNDAPADCFTTGTELYFDSRIDLSIPGGGLVVSLPDAFIDQPAGLEVDPFRSDLGPCPEYGDIFESYELNPDPRSILAANPVLDGFARLCNADGACDEVTFTLQEGEI